MTTLEGSPQADFAGSTAQAAPVAGVAEEGLFGMAGSAQSVTPTIARASAAAEKVRFILHKRTKPGGYSIPIGSFPPGTPELPPVPWTGNHLPWTQPPAKTAVHHLRRAASD